ACTTALDPARGESGADGVEQPAARFLKQGLIGRRAECLGREPLRVVETLPRSPERSLDLLLQLLEGLRALRADLLPDLERVRDHVAREAAHVPDEPGEGAGRTGQPRLLPSGACAARLRAEAEQSEQRAQLLPRQV